MRQDRMCKACEDKNLCQDIYHKLGRSTSPSVVPQVLVAFVLPIVVFICVLGAIEKIGFGLWRSSGFVTAVGSLAAFAATAGCVLVAWALRSKQERKR